MEILLLVLSVTGAFGYLPAVKNNFLSGYFLRDLVNRINGKGISEGDGVSYLDFTDGLSMESRSVNGGLEEEPMFPLDYDAVGSFNIHPSIRDQEYLQHSSIWGKQFISGGAGEGNQLLRPEGMQNKQEVKTDSTLPAYCNPPNPCPVGYTEEQGCIEEFENSASFSRRYQASQDCMCDTEHMFDCPNSNNIDDDDNMDMIDNFGFNALMKSKKINPFLTGEKLPVAAKKGNNVM
ncbi:secretogranin_V domain-containing protein 7B2 [Leptinotarsa decemlineata]|uniref:secretogranin_V domain-containing protein 7B2 n=1 Tax=Leptinotarsa decemlineata TaxID=7539 RepID=UPI000C252DA2|nr:neuroendocrine protein 7B2 [Leptinotarsa decemlineata]